MQPRISRIDTDFDWLFSREKAQKTQKSSYHEGHEELQQRISRI